MVDASSTTAAKQTSDDPGEGPSQEKTLLCLTTTLGLLKKTELEIDRRTELLRVIGRQMGIDREGMMSVDVLHEAILKTLATIADCLATMREATGANAPRGAFRRHRR